MNIRIRNLGPLSEASINLSPLTVFVGPNNAGKTWAAYVLASILGPYGWGTYKRRYYRDETQDKYAALDDVIQDMINEGNSKIDLVQFAEENAETYINNVARTTPEWMCDFFASEQCVFDDLDIHIKLTNIKELYFERILNKSLDLDRAIGQETDEPLINVSKDSGDRQLYFYTKGKVSEKLPSRAFKELIADAVFFLLHSSFFPNTRIFPTERTVVLALSQSVSKKTLTDKANDIDEATQQLDREVRFIQPVNSFLGMIGDASKTSFADRQRLAKIIPAVGEYIELAKILEKDILGGGLDFRTSDANIVRGELIYSPSKDVILDIPIASSMVKELSALVLYLRYIARPGEWLIIDEPEMNLHPMAQVRLVEFLSMLIKAGLNVLATTHSPYFVDHLANLIKAAQHQDQESIKSKFFLQQTSSFIPQNKVSVYLFENNTARDILGRDGVIDWGTFGDISDRISQIFYEI